MSVVVIARRYAEALADVATARGLVEQIDREVLLFVGMMESNRELLDVFASPIISQTDKQRVLDALTARVRPGQITVNLLRTMLNHYRLHHLGEVHAQFRRAINERKGLVVAEVTTASDFGHAEKEKLVRALERVTGKHVDLRFKTDPALIGGIVTRIGSVVYDGSVRTQLAGIKERLKQGESAV
ncbi:MAG TPA: ATP synthase F1 subunit delta [Blastocatellia bacterium]|nr:ATP synthase F1 subunit delta [Blastocatellia bacterium]